jgi:alpha-D-xyloside xylohydrolase
MATFVLASVPLAAQTPQQAPAEVPDTYPPNVTATKTAPRIEAPISGLVRLNGDAIAFTVPGMKPMHPTDAGPLLLHDFEFDDSPVSTSKLHLKELAPGVLEISSVAYQVGVWHFQVHDAANYYGLGEHFDTLNHAHTIVHNISEDNGGPKGTSTYKPIPFFMSTTGYGLWLDTTAEATFDMNVTSTDDVIVEVNADKLRIVLFSGPKFPVMLDRFTALTGRSVLPPYWAFAPWGGRGVHHSPATARAGGDPMRALGLPASVILIDSPWATNYNTYQFNPQQFKDAPAMVRYIHQHGFKMVLWHTPWIDNKTATPKEPGFEKKIPPMAGNYDEAARNQLFVKNPDGAPWVGKWWKGEGSLIDFTNPHAKLWWQDQVRHAIAAGADGFKDDDAEGSFLGDVRFADKTDQRLMRNRYAVLYNNAMEELIQKDLKGNGVLFARSVTVGANGIGFLWGGDNEASFSPENGLPTVVTAGLGAGLSGMPLWAADLGGYEKTATTPDARLLMRWTEYAAFSPIMEVMSQANISPWNFDSKNPSGATPALDNYRFYSILHMSLFPYRYAAAQVAAKTGMPILRALVLDFQDDERARQAKDEYLFGPDLLVAPVIDEGTSRPVYLPAGNWVNLFTGGTAEGGKTIVVDAALDQIPVYARAGTILPKIPEDIMTLVPKSESGNTTIHTLDDRRIYELIGRAPSTPTTITDFEGRTLVRSGNTLTIAGNSVARIIIRFRFEEVHSASVNGVFAAIQYGPYGAYIEFDYTGNATVTWR